MSNARRPHLHPLKPNDRTWTPHLVAFFDTEFPADPASESRVQMFKCAAAKLIWRRDPPPGPGLADLRTDDPLELADWVEAATRHRVPLWLYGHNVGVDLASSGLLDALLRRGWRLSRHGLANPACWAWLVKGKRTIHVCDSFSLFGTSEKRLGELLELPKLQMPEFDAPLEDWLDYCERDVEIGLAAVLDCMKDWQRHFLGRWTDTGPGCGWNSLRHRISGGTVWITPDQEAQTFERAAIYGGRRELFRFGRLPEWEYADLDLEHAHTSVAEHFPLPAERGKRFDSLPLDSPLIGGAGVGCMARVRVRTESARYPLRTDAGVVYPIGEFETELAGPEIAEARRRGELLAVGPGWGYVLKHWADRWARWLVAVLDGREESIGPMLYLLLKGASKTVWGRTAMRVTKTVSTGDGPTEELRLERGHDHSSGCDMVIIDQAWSRTIELLDGEGDDSFPAILAWIQSWVRVLVSRLVDALGDEAVVQVASDGVLVAPWKLAEIALETGQVVGGMGDAADMAMAAARSLCEDVAPLRVRLKDVLHRVSALGPETIEYDEGRTVSGVPRSAKRVQAWVYKGQVWPTFVTMSQAEISGGIVIHERIFRTDKVKPLRWIYQDGCCEPLWAHWDPETGSVSVSIPPETRCRHGGRLSRSQHPRLMRETTGRRLPVV